MTDLIDRLVSHIDFDGPISEFAPDLGPCWIWTASRTKPAGHGKAWIAGKFTTAHRAVWIAVVGPVLPDEEVDHLCRVELCVNPDHVEPVTQTENQHRSPGLTTATRTHCPQGHPYDEANTRIYRGRRYCRACNNNGGKGR